MGTPGWGQRAPAHLLRDFRAAVLQKRREDDEARKVRPLPELDHRLERRVLLGFLVEQRQRVEGFRVEA